MFKEIICGIYKITSPSGKIYIGESENIPNRIYYYKIVSCKNKEDFITLLKNMDGKIIFLK
jgi:hypothetical protein